MLHKVMSYDGELVINLISKRMRIHAGASGYDRLADFLDACVIRPIIQWTLPRRLIIKSLRFLVKDSGSKWYHRDALYSELCAGLKWFRGSGQIFHFLYGENSHRYLGVLKSKGRRNFIVCTYHTPGEIFKAAVKDRSHLAHIDAVIVVSKSQIEFFSELVGPEKVFFVPHGIDVDYFRPKTNNERADNGLWCLFVGIHLRDFETMARSARILNRRERSIHFVVVTPPKFHHYFKRLNNVDLYTSVSDEKLLRLYQDSDIFVFPLLDATANNSLLEAMACGLPIVCTDLPGVRDYVNDTCALFTPMRDSKALADAIMCLAKDESRRRKMAIASRKCSMAFEWEQIAAKTRVIYEHVSTLNSL